MSETAKVSRRQAGRRGVLPSVSSALDPLTESILNAAKPGNVKGAVLAASALANDALRVPADQAYAWACQLASPRSTRHPLLISEQVALPDPAPKMWESEFSLTHVGEMVLAGIIPNCLVNGIESKDSKMPPLRASAVARALSTLPESPSDGQLESLLSEVDFASPCVVEIAGHENWPHSGRGGISLNAMVETDGSIVRVSMIPYCWSHEDALKRVIGVVGDVPGVKQCVVVRSRTGTGFEVEISCRNEASASSATEALLASTPLKTKQKIAYMASGAEGERTSTTPVEILRAFAANSSCSPPEIARALESLDSSPRCVSRRNDPTGTLGPYVVWVLDGTGRNRTMPLTSIRCQSPGGKGTSLGGEQLKLATCSRVRSRAAIIGFFGASSSLEVRAPDTHPSWMHPAETLPQGASSPSALVVPSDKSHVVIATSMGMVKKMSSQVLCGGRRGTKQAIKLEPGDVPVAAAPCDEGDDVLLVTALGHSIRFPSSKLRESGPSSRGVAGMSLKDGDLVVSVLSISPTKQGEEIVSLLSTGKVSRVPASESPSQNRGGAGVRLLSVEDPARVVTALRVCESDELLVCGATSTSIRFRVSELPLSSRPAEFSPGLEVPELSAAATACVIPPEEERLGDPSSSSSQSSATDAPIVDAEAEEEHTPPPLDEQVNPIPAESESQEENNGN
jgi:hypothetical protein